MGLLSLTFLGAFEVSTASGAITGFRTDKVRALLTYLALSEGRPQRRERLAALFWPENDHQTALANLRLTLHRLRQTLDNASPGLTATLFSTTHSTVTFHVAAAQVDVLRFQHLMAECEVHPHADLHRCHACLARLTEAVDLYGGELLAGFGLDNAPEFEEWLLLHRETLNHQGLLALHHLATAYEAQGELEQALHYAQRKLALDPYREEAHQQIMRLLARSGYISRALAQYETCRRLLRDEVGIEPDAETVALAEQIRAGKFNKTIGEPPKDRGQEGAPQTPIPYHFLHNLPAEMTPLVGREREVAELLARLQEPGVRLLTLVGAGGIGKTRLALAVAHACVDLTDAPGDPRLARRPHRRYADGVFFVALASLSDVAAMRVSIASALGIELRGSDPDQVLIQALRTKQMLLVLDNFEHLLEGSHLVAELLERAPGVQVMTTSREHLALRSEHRYLVRGLEAPSGETVDEALQSPAVQLFVQCARRTQADFQLNSINAAHVVRICRLVHGAPLALEMAAAWVDALPVRAIASEIEQHLDFLAFDWRDAPERQRSLRAVFEWSWKLLNADERRALRGISVFRGGFTAAAAQSVAGASRVILTKLVHKSLLNWEESVGEEGRYDLHELVRQFAVQQLDSAELATVEARHSHFYLAFVAAREERMARHASKQAAAEIQGEIDNVRQAWIWAVRQQALHELDASAFTLWQFYYFTGLWSEGAGVFQLAAEGARRLMRTSDAGAEPTSLSRQALLSKLMAIHASLLISLSKHEQALTLALEAIALGEGGVSAEGEALGHLVAGQALRRKGQNQAAQLRLACAIHLAQQYQSSERFCEMMPEVEIRAYSWLCSIALSPLQDFAAARSYAEQRIALCRRWRRIYGEAFALTDLVDIARALGDLNGARSECQRVLQLAQSVGNRWLQAIISRDLGEIHRLLGEYSPGYTLTLQALTLFREVGDVVNEIACLTALGRLSTLLGEYDLAHVWFDHFQEAITTVEPLAGELLDGLLAQALLACYQNLDQQVLSLTDRSWVIAQQTGDPIRQAQVQLYRGHAYAAQGQWEAATAAYQQALALYLGANKASLAAEPRAGLAAIALAQGSRAQALEQVAVILPMLAADQRVGVDEPFYTYWVCQRVLAANGDVRAGTVLEQIYALRRHDAAYITDDAMRHRFLTRLSAQQIGARIELRGVTRP
ncbi:MAG TPA: hypothetical protein DCL15_22330 [Chloroflexi bacterium]|nr:hypothetical protein [Chloroflexota bacterium]HHW87944.1 hypothetical protein [Chloroflexota bacterium]